MVASSCGASALTCGTLVQWAAGISGHPCLPSSPGRTAAHQTSRASTLTFNKLIYYLLKIHYWMKQQMHTSVNILTTNNDTISIYLLNTQTRAKIYILKYLFCKCQIIVIVSSTLNVNQSRWQGAGIVKAPSHMCNRSNHTLWCANAPSVMNSIEIGAPSTDSPTPAIPKQQLTFPPSTSSSHALLMFNTNQQLYSLN